MDYRHIVLALFLSLLCVFSVFGQVDHDQQLRGDPNPDSPVYNRLRRQDPERYKRQGGHGGGVTGPVHTYVKTDEHAHFKWGVRHHVGHEYARR